MRATVAISSFLLGMTSAVAGYSLLPLPDKPLMIFFDWGKTEIDRDYAAQLDKQVTAVLQSPERAVTIDGFSDRSGNAAVNQRASRVRAEKVREYLVARGVAAERIAVHAWGEERPMIATADGVREPQNRRVDVRIVSASGG
jgi:outer membrane protein OmpA-like peptidoglycan-associated protein